MSNWLRTKKKHSANQDSPGVSRRKALRRLGSRRSREVHATRFIAIAIIISSTVLVVFAIHLVSLAYSIHSPVSRVARLDELSKAATTISSVFIAATFLVTSYQYTVAAALKRKLEGNEFLVSIILGRVAEYRLKLNSKVDPYGTNSNAASTYDESKRRGLLDPFGEDDILVKSFLNHLEYMCLAIHEGIIDEGFVRGSQENILFLYWKWFYPYIREMRINHYADAWIGIDYMVLRWRRKDALSVLRLYGDMPGTMAFLRLPGLFASRQNSSSSSPSDPAADPATHQGPAG